MAEESGMKKLCDWYVRRSAIIGVFYCAVPTIFWFLASLFVMPLRGVYILRLAVALVVGGALSAFANRYGVMTWLLKHRSAEGPATVLDGVIIGGSIGIGIALIPALTLLIGTNHLEDAKTYIIMSYLIAIGAGALIGAILASIGRAHLEAGAVAESE